MKHITTNFLTASCLTIMGIFSSQTDAQALEVSITNVSGNDYSLSVELEAGESISPGNLLIFRDLENVTDTDASSPFAVSTIGGGFSSTNAIFEVTNAVSEATTLSNVLQITSTSSLEDAPYDFARNNLVSDVVTSNSGTSVPFEFSPGLGIALVTGFWGLRYLKKHYLSRLS